MKLADQIKQAKTPRDAMLLLAQAIDEIREDLDRRATDPWDEPLTWGDAPPADLDVPAMTTVSGEDWSETVIRPVSEEKQALRAEWATTALENMTTLPLDEAVDAYSKGGPVWLHAFDREYVMGLPIHLRMAMVADLLEEDKDAAHMMSADLLKDPSPQELGAFLAIRPEIEADMSG